MKMNVGMMTRRSFCGSVLAATLVKGASASSAEPGQKRWYKGMLHCHSYWSDGRAFPEQAARAYREAGYHFFCLSDHNRLGADRSHWRDVCEDEGPWPKNVFRPIFERYRAVFPHADIRTKDGKTQVRIKTFDEVKAQFDEPGRFLVLPGMELSRVTAEPSWTDKSHVHVNYVNLNRGLPSALAGGLIQPYGTTPSEIVGKSFSEVKALAEELGNPPHLVMLNHPHWRFWDVSPQDVLEHPEVRFFEVCNCGSDIPLPRYLSAQDFSCDRFWDVVLAHRCRAKQDLLFGLASDDAHWYPDSGTPEARYPFADGYVQVYADALTPESLMVAMHRGDFYASCGVDLEGVSADAATGRLEVAVRAKQGVSYTIRFIGTKRDFKAGVEAEVLFKGDRTGAVGPRRIPVYSDSIGRTLKTLTGRPGERVSGIYQLQSDDLYVRAVVESSEPATDYGMTSHQHPRHKTAWTQPLRKLV